MERSGGENGGGGFERGDGEKDFSHKVDVINRSSEMKPTNIYLSLIHI